MTGIQDPFKDPQDPTTNFKSTNHDSLANLNNSGFVVSKLNGWAKLGK